MKFSRNTMPPPAQMQLAPMVDIVFLLLIFFIVTYAIRDNERELEIQVPVADQAQERGQKVGQLIVNVKADGTIILDQQVMTEQELFERMQRIASVYSEQAVIIRSDEKTDFGVVTRVLNTCARAEISNVTFATITQERP